eukprot:1157973-Pelagomonas_calceolata.AAC.8
MGTRTACNSAFLVLPVQTMKARQPFRNSYRVCLLHPVDWFCLSCHKCLLLQATSREELVQVQNIEQIRGCSRLQSYLVSLKPEVAIACTSCCLVPYATTSSNAWMASSFHGIATV